MSKPTVTIENWYIFNNRLHGEVLDHPRFDKGTAVTTSSIVKLPDIPLQEDAVVETRNTLYKLGKKYEPLSAKGEL